jgi:hypothetical protein
MLIRIIFLGSILFLSIIPQVTAQKLEQYSIFLFDLEGTGTQTTLHQPRMLTGDNVKGYNNQPFFFGDDEIWITAQTQNDTTQTEIYALLPNSKTKIRITKTPTSEYSPTLMPNGDMWSGVVVESDGVQRLWQFPINGSTGQPILKDTKGVGYHAWLNEQELVLFIVGEPHTLIHMDTKTNRKKMIASNPGRCLLVQPKDKKIYFVAKATEQTWFIKTYEPRSNKQELLCQTLVGAEDFAFLPNGQVLMGKDSKLYVYEGAQWVQIADLSELGIQKITRLATRKNKLVLVGK